MSKSESARAAGHSGDYQTTVSSPDSRDVDEDAVFWEDNGAEELDFSCAVTRVLFIIYE